MGTDVSSRTPTRGIPGDGRVPSNLIPFGPGPSTPPPAGQPPLHLYAPAALPAPVDCNVRWVDLGDGDRAFEVNRGWDQRSIHPASGCGRCLLCRKVDLDGLGLSVCTTYSPRELGDAEARDFSPSESP